MKLKLLREQKNISQTELAKHLGVVRSTICQYEKGNRIPDTETLIKIADYFNVSIDYLLGHNAITTEEREAGAAETKKISITPIEDEMLYTFREIGKKHGEQAQRALITVAEKML